MAVSIQTHNMPLQDAPQIDYPIIMRSPLKGVIVYFISDTSGICIAAGESGGTVGKFHTNWIPATDSFWQRLPSTSAITLANKD